jgi:DNA segregation ATPase FtsK/SpoIIIE, S-DNA-T family
MPVLTAVAADEPPERRVDLGPVLSIFDPMFIGIDEFGHAITLTMVYRNLLTGGEPGAGKSNLLNVALAHASLSLDCTLVLLDGKQVELGQWRSCADVFVGPDIVRALATLKRLQTVMDNRYAFLLAHHRRKVARRDVFRAIVLVIDEIAYFSATVGDKKSQDLFSALLRDLVARGRAVGIIVIAATQRPSSDIIPTSLRDLFAWRFAGRCTTDVSSDIVLGHGWAARGYSSNTISPTNPGAGLLIGEGGIPQLVKVAYLSDEDCARIAAYAATIRHLANTIAVDHRDEDQADVDVEPASAVVVDINTSRRVA